MSEGGCSQCANPEVWYTDVLGLSYCRPCWDEDLDPDWLEQMKGVRYELWQERGQRLIGAVQCDLPHGVELHDGWQPYGTCPACGARI